MSRSPVFRRPSSRPARRRIFPPAVLDTAIVPTSIPSAESFGTPGVQTGIAPTSIPSGESFGTPRVTSAASAAPMPAGPTYEALLVARIPSSLGPPTFLIVDDLPWSTISWSRELSTPQGADLPCDMSAITEAALARLRDPVRYPSEVWLLRDGQRVFAGRLLGASRSGEKLAVKAVGLLGYLRGWRVFADLVFDQVDQFAIVAALVEHWQSRPFGHFGIDTSGIGASGVLRDATYLRTESNPILARVQELGKRINGFDISVDPESRRLQLWHPLRGVDRSSGPGAIIFDRHNIDSSSLAISAGDDDVATVGFGTGTSTEGGGALWAERTNAELLAQFGAWAGSGTWDSVSQQSTLDDHVQALLDARSGPLVVPGSDVRVTDDADLRSYDVGDTIGYDDVDDRLAVSGAFRLRSLRVDVAEDGHESVTPTFV